MPKNKENANKQLCQNTTKSKTNKQLCQNTTKCTLLSFTFVSLLQNLCYVISLCKNAWSRINWLYQV